MILNYLIEGLRDSFLSYTKNVGIGDFLRILQEIMVSKYRVHRLKLW